MRLLHTLTRVLEDFIDSDLPRFAILSDAGHRQRGDDSNASNRARGLKPRRLPPTNENVTQACQRATALDIAYLWYRSLCVDETSSTVLEEAVNSSFRWLKESSVCLTYLADLPADGPLFDEKVWRKCKYWSCAWTLVELIAPSRVEFFDAEWHLRGSKSSPQLLPMLSNITGIATTVLLDCDALFDTALAVRMSWSVGRIANRQEDVAYSLVGICGTAMSVRYGEGAERAFLRLQETLLHDCCDGSILAWRSPDKQHAVRGLLARSPMEFRHFVATADAAWKRPWTFDGEVSFSSKGVCIQSSTAEAGPFVILEVGRINKAANTCERVGVRLRYWDGVHVRVDPESLVSISEVGFRQTIYAARHINLHTSDTLIDRFAAAKQPTPAVPDETSDNKQRAICHEELPERPATAMSSGLSEHDRCISTPKLASAGTKRDRWGRPKDLRQQSPSLHEMEAYSQSEESDESDDSDGSDGSSGDSHLEDSESDDSDDDPSSCDHHLGQKSSLDSPADESIRAGLGVYLYSQFQCWKASVANDGRPEDAEPRQKRARTADGASPPVLLQQKGLGNARLAEISRVPELFSFACPFYAANPDRHLPCLQKHDLRSIPGVLRHLRKHHTEPPFCPTCCRVFSRIRDRNNHAREAACEYRAIPDVEGLSEREKTRLAKQDDIRLSEDVRWLHIFATLFPEREPRPSPYLRDGLGLEVSLARDYWESSGQQCASQYLSGLSFRLTQNPGEGKPRDTLHTLALECFLEKVVRCYPLRSPDSR